jgi:hypothetical protein
VSERVRKVFFFLDCPEAFNELSVSGRALDVKFTLRKEFVLGMLFHRLNNIGASPEKDSHNLERGLVTIDTKNTE